MRIIVNVLPAFELAVRVRVAVSRVPTGQELGVDVVRPLREERPGPWSVKPARQDKAGMDNKIWKDIKKQGDK